MIKSRQSHNLRQSNSTSEDALKKIKGIYDFLILHKELKDTVFTLPEEIFFWASDFEVSDLNDFLQIKTYLQKIGELTKSKNLRLISNFSLKNNFLNGNSNKDIKKLLRLGEIFDIMNLSRTYFNEICISFHKSNIDKKDVLHNFSEKFKLLPQSVRKRLTVQNNSSVELFSTKDLFYGIFMKTGIPIKFNSVNHSLNSGGQTEEEAYDLALATWNSNHILTNFKLQKEKSERMISHFFLKNSKIEYLFNSRNISSFVEFFSNKPHSD